jgi:hypothetical protein
VRMRLKPTLRWTTLALYCLLLAMLLVACGATGSSSSSGTTSPSTLTPTPKSTATTMTNLVGNGFTMNYPHNWQVTRSGTHLVTLVDSTNAMKFTITVVPDPKEAVSADSLANTGIKAAAATLKNSQTVPVPPTATIGGDTWSQRSVSGVQRLNNADTSIQVVVVADVHPAKAPVSKGYTIAYRAPKSTFDSAKTTYFQPMLQSFKFV